MSRASEWVLAWVGRPSPATDPMCWWADPPRPHWGCGHHDAIAYVRRGDGWLQIGDDVAVDPKDALKLADWIRATFGEGPSA